MPVELRRQVIFSNAVYWVVGGLLMISNVIRFQDFLKSHNQYITPFIPLVIVGMAGLCLLLNYGRSFLLSRVLFTLSWIVLIVLVPVIFVGPTPSTYYQHPYFGILFSPVVHLLFSYKREKLFYLFFVLVFFILALFALDFLLYFDRSVDPKVPLVSSPTGFRVNLIIFWLFLNLLMVYVLRINSRLYQELEQKSEVINKQNAILDQHKIQLGEQNKVLEEKVSARTKSLMDQNEKLKEYAFMHAHILRAPISRIRGLINLMGLTNDTEEQTHVRSLIGESMTELEDVAKSMSDKLNEDKK